MRICDRFRRMTKINSIADSTNTFTGMAQPKLLNNAIQSVISEQQASENDVYGNGENQ